jgi:hypothetical protein
MKLAYIRKITFNINEMTIHFTFGIPLNTNLKKLQILSDERRDTLMKTYDQLQLLVIDELSLVGKMFLKKHVLLILNDQLIQMKLMALIMNYFLRKTI